MNKNATVLYFLRYSNHQAQRLAGRDLIAIMAPSTIFLLWLWLTKVWYYAAANGSGEAGGWFGQLVDPFKLLWERARVRGRDWEKLREIEKEDGRDLQKKFTLPVTNQSWKFARPLVIHCYSYLEGDCCDHWFDGPTWVEALLGIAGLRDAKKE